MSGLRLFTEEEDAANTAAADPFAAELVHPNPRAHRWHCARCGRFVRFATVRKLPPRPGEADEHEYRGTCPAHGENVDIVWPEG